MHLSLLLSPSAFRLRERRSLWLAEKLKKQDEITDGIAEGFEKRSELQQASLQRDIDFHKRSIDVQAKLAAGGKENTLAQEQAAAVRAEEKKLQDQKKFVYL